MCEWVEFCPRSWESIETAPCKAAINFLPQITECLDGVWLELQKVLQADEKFIKRIQK